MLERKLGACSLKLCQSKSIVRLEQEHYRYILFNRPFYSCVLSYLALNANQAGGDLALIQIRPLFLLTE